MSKPGPQDQEVIWVKQTDVDGTDTKVILEPDSNDRSSAPAAENNTKTVVNGKAAPTSVGPKNEDCMLSVPIVDSVAAKMSSHTSLLGDRSASTVTFHNVNYTVEVATGCCCRKRKEDKYILKNVSGICKSGMNAILGPTGSGKTSLLDVLAGRKDPRGLIGEVLIDGARQPENFKCMAGYVIQDDIVMGMLTVRENVQFSAALRLPSSMPESKRNERVECVLEELGLLHCADTKVGTAFRRGVSGGERKRTSIAMELITSPSVLFLDEPTTGLDSNTAQNVMMVLQKLSRRGRTVIFSIHQPRYSIFKLFDNLILLSQGQRVYHGPAYQALDYFKSIGYECEEHNNPGDFFLDIINGAVSPEEEPLQIQDGHIPSNTRGSTADLEKRSLVLDVDENEDATSAATRCNQLTENFRKSTWHESLQEELNPIYENFQRNDTSVTTPKVIGYATSFCTQLRLVSGRTFKNMIRNPHTLTTQVFAAVIFALIVGVIYYKVDSSATGGIQNRIGAFFFIVLNHVFGNMAAVDLFIKERAIFIHENISGYYRVSSYFLAKFISDVLPMKAVPVIVFSCITYWMIGLQADAAKFFLYMLNTFLTSVTATTVALILSATTDVHIVGTILTSLIWVFMMIFGGLLVNLNTIAAWLHWLKYFSIFKYSMNTFLINEMKDQSYCDTPSNTTTPATHGCDATKAVCNTGNDYMREQGVDYETAWDLWHNQLALVALMVGFLLLTYIQLRRIKKLK